MPRWKQIGRAIWGRGVLQGIGWTLYYLLILLGLLWIYGMNDGAPPSHFIYTDF